MNIHLLSVKLDVAMDNQPPRLVDTMHKTASEQENIQSPLHLDEHHASDRCKTFLLNFFLELAFPLLNLRPPLGIFLQIVFVVTQHLSARTHIGYRVGQVPAFEYFLGDIFAVVCAYSCLGLPALLEKCFA